MNLYVAEWPAILLLALGAVAIWLAMTGGAASGQSYDLRAYEVTHDSDGLELTDVETGETHAGNSVARTDVDERVVCRPEHTVECVFFRSAFEEDGTLPHDRSEFSYAYLDGEFYDVQATQPPGTGELVRTDAASALEDLAIGDDRLTDTDREALENGRVLTTRRSANSNRIVEYEGGYYTLYHVGVAEEDGTCTTSPGSDFCDEAERQRTVLWLQQVGLGLLGVLGVLLGGVMLVAGPTTLADRYGEE